MSHFERPSRIIAGDRSTVHSGTTAGGVCTIIFTTSYSGDVRPRQTTRPRL